MDAEGVDLGARLAIVADDLTGAADAAAPFAAAGIASAVALRRGTDPGTLVVALSTESRDLPEAEALAAVRAAAAALSDAICPRWWYKKIDSMWRGWPEAESRALADAIGMRCVILAPTLPARGRAVRGGAILVGRDRVADPAVGAAMPLGRLGLAEIRAGLAGLSGTLRSLPGGAILADGETDEDLHALVEASLTAGVVLLAGSAGMACRLAAVLPLPRSPRPPLPAAAPVLAVIASRHPAAATQIAAADAAGVGPVVRAPIDGTLADLSTRERLASSVANGLAHRRSVLLTTAPDAASPMPGRELALGLAQVAAHPDVVAQAAAFYLSGGDAAAACLHSLAADALLLGGEVEPGVPWGVITGGPAGGRPLVTKAGSFGDEDTLVRCLAFLNGAEHGAARSDRPKDHPSLA
jgi:uncharacterized protein YgbK (DUF1537 family)